MTGAAKAEQPERASAQSTHRDGEVFGIMEFEDWGVPASN